MALFVALSGLVSGWLSDRFIYGWHKLGHALGYVNSRIILSLVFVFILTDHWEGVGFLIAAKSVFRFGDLKESKDRKLTEYILIGTLLSFAMAIIMALACIYLIKIFSP